MERLIVRRMHDRQCARHHYARFIGITYVVLGSAVSGVCCLKSTTSVWSIPTQGVIKSRWRKSAGGYLQTQVIESPNLRPEILGSIVQRGTDGGSKIASRHTRLLDGKSIRRSSTAGGPRQLRSRRRSSRSLGERDAEVVSDESGGTKEGLPAWRISGSL